ncbi:unnamed protein product [Trichobilharzia szidati]|nr:unnamed protein product [Trichobilharzia szidati]
MAGPQPSGLCLSDTPSEWINKLLYRDGLFRDLMSTLEIDKYGKVGFSGNRELDYPLLNENLSHDIEVIKSFPLPQDLVERFTGMQTNCLMGVFTSCEKVWVTIDNEIFMWNFEDGEDLAYYDGMPDTIVSVALIVPSPGVLPEHIRFLLCLATPSEIWLLGMMYSNGSNTHTLGMQSSSPVLEVMPDPLYYLSTENNYISCIEGTPNGRIFLGTREGFLLEMTYSSIPNWEAASVQPNVGKSGPCTLVNHSVSAFSLLLPSIITSRFHNGDSIVQLSVDTPRHLLYTRTEDSRLTVYEFTDKISGSFSRLSTLSASDLAYQASCIVRSVDKNQFRNIISVTPLSSGLCYLMAVTRTGIRLYFGENLRLLHIRLPPSSPFDTVGLSEVKLAVETRGTVVMISTLPPSNVPTTTTLNNNSSRFKSSYPVSVNHQSSLNMSLGQFFPSDLDNNQFLNQSNCYYNDNNNNNIPDSFTTNDFDSNALNAFTKQIPPHIIYTISPDPYPWTPNLAESFMATQCIGGAWAITVLPDNHLHMDSFGSHLAGYSTTTTTAIDKSRSDSLQVTSQRSSLRGEPPVVLTQILDPPSRRLLLISAQGVVHFRLPSPLTRLQEYLSREFASNTSMLPLSGGGGGGGYTDHQISEMMSTSPGYIDSSLKLGFEGGYLTAYLLQFSADEAICAALAIGAAAAISGGQAKKSLQFAAEQAALYFAAEASQYWPPAVIRSRAVTNLSYLQSSSHQASTGTRGGGGGGAGGNISSNTGDDSSLNSALHLFTGVCVFLSRITRCFWRSSMFFDATSICAKYDVNSSFTNSSNSIRNKPTSNGGGLKSWVKSLIHTLSTASTFGGGGGRGKSSESSEQIIISRLETSEISWLLSQITYVQQFIQRQLNVRGGWFRLSPQSLSSASTHREMSTKTMLDASDEHVDGVALQRLAEELDHLLSMIGEILGFWEILSEHVVHKIMRRLNNEHRDLALQLTIESYISSLMNIQYSGSILTTLHHGSLAGDNQLNKSPITSSSVISTGVSGGGGGGGTSGSSNQTGTEVIGALITALIEYYLLETSEEVEEGGSIINVETITSRLQSTCPSLFANEDAMCAKASECLIQASIIRINILSTLNDPDGLNDLQYEASLENKAHIDQLVSEAIQLYIEAGPSINLENAVHRLESCNAWRGAIRLCLSVARSRDPSDIAVDCLKKGRRPSSDPILDFDHRGGVGGHRSKHNRAFAISELAATEGRYDAYRRLTICLDHLLHAAQIKSDATFIVEQPNNVSTTTTNSMLNMSNTTVNGNDISKVGGMKTKIGYDTIATTGTNGTTTGGDSFTLVDELDSSPQYARSTLQTVLIDISRSDDILAHFEVFNWLLSHGLTDTVISLNSPNLEPYLRSRLRQTPDDPGLRCLLWRQLERRGARLEAAQVLEHLAVTPCRQLTLDDRLDFAARAIVAVKALPTSQQDLDYLKDLETRLELAQLQQLLLNELKQYKKQLIYHQGKKQSIGSPIGSISPASLSPHRSHIPLGSTIEDEIDEAILQLTHGALLSVTEMFADYADRFGLHESKLCLLWASGSQDYALIKAIWRDLLRRILTQSSTSVLYSPTKRSPPFTPYNTSRHPVTDSKTTRSTQQLIELSLQDCLSRFSNRFLDDSSSNHLRGSIYFPLTDIISTLEYYAIQHKLSASWVPNILRDSHLLCIANITEAYNELIHSKDSLWRRDEVQHRLFNALITVIDDFLRSTVIRLPVRQRMLQTDRMLNQITGLLVDLNSDIATTCVDDIDRSASGGGGGGKTSNQQQWIDSLRCIHEKLQRLNR